MTSIDLPPGSPAARWTSRRLAQLACLLPAAALILFLLVLFAWPNEPHRKASDLQTILFFVSLGLMPVAVVASCVLATMAFLRARREARAGATRPARVGPSMAILVGFACAAVRALVLWAALAGLSGFR